MARERRIAWVDTQNRQLADGDRNVDEGNGTVVPRPDEQRLGLREAAADSGPGRFGWTVSRIADATAVRRETATRHLRAAGLAVRARGRSGDGK